MGDFNGDGNLDLAVANNGSNTVSVLLGDGTGHFTWLRLRSAGTFLQWRSGDFNGDGKLDLVVVNAGIPSCQVRTVSVLLGDGTGNFTLASSPATGAYPWSVAVGDFNGDGKLDLAVVNSSKTRFPSCSAMATATSASSRLSNRVVISASGTR